ncbi:hypothetical protein [Pseudoalteromonas sp. S16_S37]|uniref:hypothetical protein n=1 Tax=Pseudoalteromonas sp. S16_S37 TaxID=2720228 RepID=UPI001680EB06|nr:hypothetical protein [Pseudoalteromonas sp. S16_S37]MBD1583487.1 hypothetical protein [Pseudoalteromonas sp. S16_S37]
MIGKNDAISVSAYLVNWLSAALNALLLFFGGLSINEWGVLAGILFGAITAIVNYWSRVRLVKIAAESGKVSL